MSVLTTKSARARMALAAVLGLGMFAWGQTAPVTANEDPERKLLDISAASFANPTMIDNEWKPLKPGTQLIYEGVTLSEDGEQIPHRIVFTVTDLIKEINGMDTVVIFDRDYSDELLQESELTFLAQDDDGNVWHLGQYTEAYDEIELVGGRMWAVGHTAGAKAGIMMKAEPTKLGEPSYSQGWAPEPFNWTDRAQTYKVGETYETPAGKFDNVLVTQEFSEQEPEAFQLKYYAQGIGNIGVGWTGEDPNKETLKLVEIKQLTPEEMDEARAEALKLEERAFTYGTTKPARQR